MIEENKTNNVTASDMELLLRTRDQMPDLYNRVMGLLDIVHESKMSKADDIEYKVVDNLRNMGKDALTAWGEKQSQRESAQLLELRDNLKLGGKKKSIGKLLMDK